MVGPCNTEQFGPLSEFQKFAGHPVIVINFPLGALAVSGLSRAYAISGDTAKGRAAYQNFVTVQKDPDPDIPIVKEAKAEYARLHIARPAIYFTDGDSPKNVSDLPVFRFADGNGCDIIDKVESNGFSFEIATLNHPIFSPYLRIWKRWRW